VSVTINAVIDCIYQEDGFATVTLEEKNEVDIYTELLPKNIKAGDNLRLVISVVPANGHHNDDDIGGFIKHDNKQVRWRDSA